MSATELATVIEGWATLAGLFVVIAGAVFAGVQLRQEARARRFEATAGAVSAVMTPELIQAVRSIRSLPNDFVPGELPPGQRENLDLVIHVYARLGALLADGYVEDRDVFSWVGTALSVIELWEKLKNRVRVREQEDPLRPLMFVEYCAYRAHNYVVRDGAQRLGRLPHFDADPEAMIAVGREVAAARATAA